LILKGPKLFFSKVWIWYHTQVCISYGKSLFVLSFLRIIHQHRMV